MSIISKIKMPGMADAYDIGVDWENVKDKPDVGSIDVGVTNEVLNIDTNDDIAVSGSSSSSGPQEQADYSENDTTANSYIKNRPVVASPGKTYAPLENGASFSVDIGNGTSMNYNQIDNYLSREELIGMTIRITQGDFIQEKVLSASDFSEDTMEDGVHFLMESSSVIVSTDGPVSTEVVNIPSAGTYIIDDSTYQLIKPTSYEIKEEYQDLFNINNRLEYYIYVDNTGTVNGREVVLSYIRENNTRKTTFTNDERNNIFNHYLTNTLIFRYYDVEHGEVWKPVERYVDRSTHYYSFYRRGQECVVVI